MGEGGGGAYVWARVCLWDGGGRGLRSEGSWGYQENLPFLWSPIPAVQGELIPFWDRSE